MAEHAVDERHAQLARAGDVEHLVLRGRDDHGVAMGLERELHRPPDTLVAIGDEDELTGAGGRELLRRGLRWRNTRRRDVEEDRRRGAVVRSALDRELAGAVARKTLNGCE